MKVLIVQNSVFQEIADTLNHIEDLLDKQEKDNIDLIVFPEMFTTPYQHDAFDQYRQTKTGPVSMFLSRIAKRYHAYVIGGSVPYLDQETLYNTTFVYEPKGEVIGRYDKIHLFEVTYPDGQHFNEADTLGAGQTTLVFETPWAKIGVMICFDVRFPELAEALMKQGADVIVVPAAFNEYTGPLHWETTFRARAIDNQLFMIGCSPSAASFGNYKTYGKSLVVDPLGVVIQSLGRDPACLLVNLDIAQVKKTREQLPIVKNKRNSIL